MKRVIRESVIRDGAIQHMQGPSTVQAVQARNIAHHLPRPELLLAASVVHNYDERFTGIRFETAAGPFLVLMPVEAGFSYAIVYMPENRIVGSIVGNVASSQVSAPKVAFRISEYFGTRGLI
ncbi:hypothetical protein ACWD01_37275 [Streptomyces sp. NPDC002835]